MGDLNGSDVRDTWRNLVRFFRKYATQLDTMNDLEFRIMIMTVSLYLNSKTINTVTNLTENNDNALASAINKMSSN